MNSIDELKAISNTAVRRLRLQKLKNGKPFLVWSRELPQNQSYMEFPDHSIKIVTLSADSKSFTIIQQLEESQAQILRTELALDY